MCDSRSVELSMNSYVSLFRCSVLLVVGLGLTLLLVGTTVATATASFPDQRTATATTESPDSTTGTDLAYPPQNLSTTVVIEPAISRVTVEAWYPARTEAEARQYRNGTVDLSWFETDERLQRSFTARNETLEPLQTRTQVSDSIEYPTHGEVHISIQFRWQNGATEKSASSPRTAKPSPPTGIFEDSRSRLILGPTITAHLAENTTVQIVMPAK